MQFVNFVNKTVLFIVDFFYPEFCAECEKILNTSEEIALCKECRQKFIIRKNPDFICWKCGKEINVDLKTPKEIIVCRDCLNAKLYFDQCRHLFHYSGLMEKIIKKYKYKKKKDYSEFLAEELYAYLKNSDNNYSTIEFDFITNVPQHKNKLKKEEFNHIDILCSKLCKKLKIKYLPDIVIKIKKTQNQAGLRRKERLKNLKNAFQINTNFNVDNFDNKKILLIDDVFSTGSTINEVSKPLKKICPSLSVYGLTIARG